MTGAVLVTVGCQPAGADRPSTLIRVANTGTADFDDLPSLAAHAALEAGGYRLEETRFRETAQAAEALARGDVDLGSGAAPIYWAATAKGAPIRLIAEHVANMHRLVGPADAAGCAGLGEGPIAVQSSGAASDVFTRAWLEDTCPGQTVQIVRLPQSDSRMAALLSGSVRAAALKVVDVVRLDREAPGRFVELADFSSSFPLVMAAGVFVNRDWAEANRPALTAYLEARRAAEERLSDAGALVGLARTSLGESADWPAVAAAYLRVRAWRAARGVTPEAVVETLRFFSARAGLAPLAPDLAADLTLLRDPDSPAVEWPGRR